MEAIDFWIWFANNKKSIEDFLNSDFSDYSPYERLNEELKQYSDLVVPELTMDGKGNYVLVLSCDGRRRGIPKVEELADSMPVIENWLVRKFRQKSTFYGFSIQGIAFQEDEILVSYQEAEMPNQLILTMYLKDYQEDDKRFGVAAVVYLDHNVGEYNAMTKINNIYLDNLTEQTSTKELLTLHQLAEVLENM